MVGELIPELKISSLNLIFRIINQVSYKKQLKKFY